MNYVGSDLEEGEILDDSPSSPCFSHKITKELPRRYVFRENRGTRKNKNKHTKKDCRNAIRYHARKLVKLKKTPTKLKDTHKSKSCSHSHTSAVRCKNYDSKSMSKPLIPKNDHTFLNHTLGQEIKCSFSEYSKVIHNQSIKSGKLRKHHKETENIKIVKNCSFYEMLENFKSRSKNINNSIINSNLSSENSVESSADVHNAQKSEDEKNMFNGVSADSLEVKSGESEDEEELRRIALSTCAKRIENPSEILVPKNTLEELHNCIVPDFSDAKTFSLENKQVSDNHEVVDMDIDEDVEHDFETINSHIFIDENVQTSHETVNSHGLFFIDKKPDSDFQSNSISEPQTAEDCSDDDFQTEILRAELSESISRRSLAVEEAVIVEQQCDSLLHKSSKSDKHVDCKKPAVEGLVTVEETCDNSLDTDKCSKSDKHVLKENTLKKSENVNTYPNKIIEERTEAAQSPKRLIISLKEESSSEDSDQEEFEVNGSPENPVASIEALISGIRQKSDSNETNNDNVNVIPKSLSCLSKAQQEEYNSLVKILAKKKKKVTLEGNAEDKNGGIHSPLNDLKSLEKNLLTVSESLKKKKKLMTSLSAEVTAKKQVYMKSKLSAQHLKEQYVAAEKVRRVKLEAWSKSCKNFNVVKKSVSDLESKIMKLQKVCSKVGASIQGQNYNLPTKKKLT